MCLIKSLLIILSDGVRKQGCPRTETASAFLGDGLTWNSSCAGHYAEKDVTLSPKVCVFVYSVQYPWAVTCIYGYSRCYSWATCPQTGPSFVSLQQYRLSLQLEGSGSWKLYARPCFSHTLKYIWIQWLDFWNVVPSNLIVVLNNTARENGKACWGRRGRRGGRVGGCPPLGPPHHLTPKPQHNGTTSVLEEQMSEIKWKLRICVCWDPRVLKLLKLYWANGSYPSINCFFVFFYSLINHILPEMLYKNKVASTSSL